MNISFVKFGAVQLIYTFKHGTVRLVRTFKQRTEVPHQYLSKKRVPYKRTILFSKN